MLFLCRADVEDVGPILEQHSDSLEQSHHISCAFGRADGKVSAARRNARVRPRGHLIASMERQP